MKVAKLKNTSLDVNSYIVCSDNNKTAVIIDPALETMKMTQIIKELDIVYIVNTHGHFDHIAGNGRIKELKGSKIIIHKNDADMLGDSHKNLSYYFIEPVVSPAADIIIQDESYRIEIDGIKLLVIEVPGHTEGSIALYNPEQNILFPGDLIFRNSIGRTDFPGGDKNKMKNSIDKILKLPDNTFVYPGHEEDFLLSDFRKVYQYILNYEL